MADKKTKTTKPATKNQSSKNVSVTKEIITNEANTEILNKILVCLYAIIVVLVINTTILLVKGNSSSTATTSKEEPQETTEYDVSMFTKVTSDNIKEAVSSDTAKLVYVGRSTCGYCVKFLPVLQKAQDEYKYETLYLDITTITTTEQQDKILELDNEEEFLKSNFGGTPMVLLMKNGKIVDTWMGYAEYATYAEWLEKNGFTK